MPTAAEHLDVAIIGAGFSGIAAALALNETGRQNFAVFEKAATAGGVWRENIYPGCRCDVPSRVYELAARPNPNWTRNFSPQNEIYTYLNTISTEPDLAPHFRFNHAVTDVRFDDQTGHWHLNFTTQNPVTARALLLGLGPLSRPRIPDIPGRDTFAGLQVHTANWTPDIDLTGKRVAVIGTGASAIQIVPELARHAAHLSVFQRRAPWILPRAERRFSTTEQTLTKRFPALHQLSRSLNYRKLEFFGNAYQRKGLAYALLVTAAALKRRTEIKNKDLRRKLTPTDRIGCRRALLSDDYLPVFNQSNVSLLDSAAHKIDQNGVTCADQRRADVDVIIWATGFNVTDPTGLLPIYNARGIELAELWQREGPQAHRSTAVSGFANMAYLLGPNGGLGHSSAVHFIESQLVYVLAYLDHLDTTTAPAALDLPRATQDRYNRWVQSKLQNTAWGKDCQSWYSDSHGINRSIFPGLSQDYRRQMAHFDATEFEISNPKSDYAAEENSAHH